MNALWGVLGSIEQAAACVLAEEVERQMGTPKTFADYGRTFVVDVTVTGIVVREDNRCRSNQK